MKTKILSLILSLGVLGVLAVSAQTSSPTASPTPPSNFFNSLTGYLSNNDTNFTFAGNRLELSVGADYLGGLQWANYVAGQYNFGTNGWTANAKIRNLGIAGTISGFEVGPGYNVYQSYAIQLNVALYGGYDRIAGKGLVEPALTFRKKATENTYFEIGTSLPVQFGGSQSWVPNIFVGTGCSF